MHCPNDQVDVDDMYYYIRRLMSRAPHLTPQGQYSNEEATPLHQLTVMPACE